MNDKKVSGNARGRPKVTAEQVRAIVSYFRAHPNTTRSGRATLFGVSYATIYGIELGRTWQYITALPNATPFQRAMTDITTMVQRDVVLDAITARLYKTVVNSQPKRPCLQWDTQLAPGRHYPVVGGYGRTYLVHRFVYECKYIIKNNLSSFIMGKMLPPGLLVRHMCGNPMCCEPTHLRGGTAHQNNLDTLRHGRNRSSVLTKRDVRSIREMAERGLSNTAIARIYNVTRTSIYHIVNRKTWKHVS